MQNFIYVGDVAGTHIDTITLEETLLEATPETRVLDDAATQIQRFTTQPDLRLVAAHAADTPSTVVLKTRGAMYLP